MKRLDHSTCAPIAGRPAPFAAPVVVAFARSLAQPYVAQRARGAPTATLGFVASAKAPPGPVLWQKAAEVSSGGPEQRIFQKTAAPKPRKPSRRRRRSQVRQAYPQVLDQ